jgi:HK97 family phage portal protein
VGFLDSIFETKATRSRKKVDASAAISRATSVGYNTWGGEIATTTNWDLDKAVTKGYERVIWVWRCVHVIASAQASVPILLKDYNVQEGHIVENKQLQKLLNRRTNEYEDAWAFRYRLSGQLLLSPKGAFIELVKAGSGEVMQMFLLNPENVEPIRDPRKWVKGYKVKRGDGQEDILDPEDVMWIRTQPHMIDPYKQMTPLIAAGLAAETDYLARMFNRNFLKNDGRPGMLISIDGDLSGEDGLEIKNKFSGGYSHAGETTVLEAQGINVVDMSSRPRDVQWNEAIQGSKDDILLAFGCPESVLGNASGRCLRASELVHLASGVSKPAEELVGQKFQLLQPSKEGPVVVNAVAEYAKTEPIYKITTFSGRTLETNGEHPLFMGLSRAQGPFKRDLFPIGWTPMKDIDRSFHNNDCVGTKTFTEVAVPVNFPQISADRVSNAQIRKVAAEFSTIPEELFTADLESQQDFVSDLYSQHGRLSQHTSFDIYPPSYEYAVRLQRLLLRIGVHSTVTTKKLSHMVSISGKINMFNFLAQLNLSGDAFDKAEAVRARLTTDKGREHNAFRSDGLPPGLIWDRVLSVEEIGEDQTVALTVGSSTAKDQDHSYLGIFWEHNTYNNAEAEVEQWWTGTMKTHCDAIARNMEALTGSDDDELYLEYDYTTVDVLQRAERRKHDKLAQDLARGAITMDDYRIGTGRAALNIPATRVLIHPTKMVAGSDPADVEAVRNLPVIGASQDPMGGANPFMAQPADGIVGGINDFQNAELSANETGDPAQTVNDVAARTLRSAGDLGISPNNANPNSIVEISNRIDQLLNSKDWKPVEDYRIDFTSPLYYDVKGRLQGAIESALITWSNRQLEVASTRITHAKVRKGTRHWDGEPGTKSLDTGYVIDTTEWVSDLKTSLSGVLLKNLQLFDPEGKFSDEIAEVSQNSLQTLLDEAELQTELLKTHIGVLDISGKSINEITDTLKPESFDRPDWIIQLSEKIVARVIVSVDGVLSSFVDDVETKRIRFVRTVSGVRRFGLDKGSIIVDDNVQPLDALRAVTNDIRGYEKVADSSGNAYYVGKENGVYVARNPLDNSIMYQDADERAVFEWLNKKVGGSSIHDPNGSKPNDAFDASPNKKPGDTPGRQATRTELTSNRNLHLTAGQASAADTLTDSQLREYLKQRQRGLMHAQALSAARKIPAKKKK